MGKERDKIMEASRKGCIEDWNSIEKILGKIAELSMGDMLEMLGDRPGDSGKILAEAFLNEEHELELDRNAVEAVKMTELLCLTDGTRINCYDDDFEEEQMALNNRYVRRRSPFWYTSVDLILNMFQEGQKKDTLFRQFWCISLEELLKGLSILDLARHPGEVEEESGEEQDWGGFESGEEQDWESFGYHILDRIEDEDEYEGAYGEDEIYDDGAYEFDDYGEPCEEDEIYGGEEYETCDCAAVDVASFIEPKTPEEEFNEDMSHGDYEAGEEEERKEKHYMELKKEFHKRANYLQISLKPGMTIGETLEQAKKVAWGRWRLSESMYIYGRRVLTAYEIIRFLLMESFRFLEAERFCQESILEKYENSRTEGK